jgi:hypothetical protein
MSAGSRAAAGVESKPLAKITPHRMKKIKRKKRDLPPIIECRDGAFRVRYIMFELYCSEARIRDSEFEKGLTRLVVRSVL